MSAEQPGRDPTGEGVAEQVARLLAIVLERASVTLSELAAAASMDPVDAAPLIEALARSELVAWQPGSSVLRPGAAAERFARAAVDRQDLVEIAQASMQRLADESGETANLYVPTRAGTEALAQIDGVHLLGVTNWLERELELHCTAAGKVFLAFGVAELPPGELRRVTAATVTDRRLLGAQLQETRARGYATIVDELEPGLSAVAAPVRDRAGVVVAALSASGASVRLPPARLALLGRVALEQAHELAVRLGHDGPLEDYPAAGPAPSR
jgi:IclR family acetate operon transcriptional repressor